MGQSLVPFSTRVLACVRHPPPEEAIDIRGTKGTARHHGSLWSSYELHAPKASSLGHNPVQWYVSLVHIYLQVVLSSTLPLTQPVESDRQKVGRSAS